MTIPVPNYTVAELEQLAAPIALYPDALLSQVLMASTYPLEVVMAARWVAEPQNAVLHDDALTSALDAKDWDPSVKSLVPFPDVLERMNENLEWTEKIGTAFVAREDDVMAAVQRLRLQARAAGKLQSGDKQKVTVERRIIIIEPAVSNVVYVPYYDPLVVYGPWPYADYPPYAWRPPRGFYFVAGWWWGPGIFIVGPLWGWGWFDWPQRDIYIDVHRYNRIGHRRRGVDSPVWRHEPRGGFPDDHLREPRRGPDGGIGTSPPPGIHEIPSPPPRPPGDVPAPSPAPSTPLPVPRQYRIPELKPPRSVSPPPATPAPAPTVPRQYRLPEQTQPKRIPSPVLPVPAPSTPNLLPAPGR